MVKNNKSSFDKAVRPSRPRVDAGIEADPVKNAAADQIIGIVMGDIERDNGDNTSYGVPQKLIDEAGKALANRYCFAIGTQDGSLNARITPIRFYKEEGRCGDQTGPINSLLPKCGEIKGSTWEFYDPEIKTPLDAAKYLQQLGFFWNKGFQNSIDKSLTKELSVLEPAKKKPRASRALKK